MLVLCVNKYETLPQVELSLKGEGTVINTQIFEDQVRHVAKYIKVYEPQHVFYNNNEFEEDVKVLLKKMY